MFHWSVQCSVELCWIYLKLHSREFQESTGKPSSHTRTESFLNIFCPGFCRLYKEECLCVCVHVRLCESVQYVLSGRTCTILYHPTTAQTLAGFSMRSQRSFSKVGLHSLHLQRHVAPKYGRNWESLKTFCFSACHSLTCYFCQWQRRHLPLMLVTCWDSCC